MTTLKSLERSVVRVPGLVVLELNLHFVEVHVQILLLSDGGSEMQVHLSVVTSLKALLIIFLVVVETTIEVWHLLI